MPVPVLDGVEAPDAELVGVTLSVATWLELRVCVGEVEAVQLGVCVELMVRVRVRDAAQFCFTASSSIEPAYVAAAHDRPPSTLWKAPRGCAKPGTGAASAATVPSQWSGDDA